MDDVAKKNSVVKSSEQELQIIILICLGKELVKLVQIIVVLCFAFLCAMCTMCYNPKQTVPKL